MDSMACEFDDVPDVDLEAAGEEAAGDGAEISIWHSARQKRAVSQPLVLNSNSYIICHSYPERRAGVASGSSTNTARLCYYLPDNWSAAYKYSVFEGSYVVSLTACDGGLPAGAMHPLYHLARPLPAQDDPCHLRAFELVWPNPLDRAFLDAVQQACDRVQPGTKRKSHDPVISNVHLKLRKLTMSNE
mmetsp:Transcript_37064/g.61355  ORF Transcript_37064/g.61355 Transcript_37064/m.61355 type:complete len:188 (-) Transcript_37064:95-658(-)